MADRVCWALQLIYPNRVSWTLRAVYLYMVCWTLQAVDMIKKMKKKKHNVYVASKCGRIMHNQT